MTTVVSTPTITANRPRAMQQRALMPTVPARPQAVTGPRARTSAYRQRPSQVDVPRPHAWPDAPLPGLSNAPVPGVGTEPLAALTPDAALGEASEVTSDFVPKTSRWGLVIASGLMAICAFALARLA